MHRFGPEIDLKAAEERARIQAASQGTRKAMGFVDMTPPMRILPPENTVHRFLLRPYFRDELEIGRKGHVLYVRAYELLPGLPLISLPYAGENAELAPFERSVMRARAHERMQPEVACRLTLSLPFIHVDRVLEVHAVPWQVWMSIDSREVGDFADFLGGMTTIPDLRIPANAFAVQEAYVKERGGGEPDGGEPGEGSPGMDAGEASNSDEGEG